MAADGRADRAREKIASAYGADTCDSRKVSIVLLAYNQERFIRQAVTSCLNQRTKAPIEIVLSDDCSSDSTYDLMCDLAAAYTGPHHVVVRRNATNLGIGAHLNACISASSGELIVLAAGDDISRQDRVERLFEKWEEGGCQSDILTSDVIQISPSGEILGHITTSDLALWNSPEKWIADRPFVIGAAHAMTRRLHQRFGDFDSAVVQEDQIISFRAAGAGGGAKVNEALVQYRTGGISQQKSVAASPVGYLRWSRSQYDRQVAQYEQIYADLCVIGMEVLWAGKLARRLDEAKFVVAMHDNARSIEKLNAFAQHPQARVFFRIKHAIFVGFPGFAAAIQKIQNVFKGRK